MRKTKKKIILIIVLIIIIAFGFGIYSICEHKNLNYLVDFYTGAEQGEYSSTALIKLASAIKSEDGAIVYCEFEKYGVNFDAKYVVGGPFSEITYTIVGDYTDEEIQNAYDKIYRDYKETADICIAASGVGFSFDKETSSENILVFGVSGLSWNVAFSKDYDSPVIHYYYEEIA